MSNGLRVARRRHRVAHADVERLVELYRALPVRTDDAAGPDLLGRLRAVADAYDLSAYDAAYLELAQRRGLRLATLDRALARAARKAGVDALRL
ncbi:MAG: type II toxin-antitoxin system VapC family toxin [Acidobacteria bacterium]|nr:type II toxin-antitoxin system VapC family toxin [Acidobacteriota bacterium]